jgi:3-phosphoshikimate 1-carboxyvinyltransferase
MKAVRISHPTRIIGGTFEVPASKSISNRLLIMQALSEGAIRIRNLSDADDTRLMGEALKTNNGTVNIENAGTCMRMLTAYYSMFANDVILHGNDRMHERPIEPLVTALQQLGADIDYIDREGYPPLRIKGNKLHGGTIQMDASVSSQFISAIMLVAPYIGEEVNIEFISEPVSLAYLKLTEEWMLRCGANVDVYKNRVRIAPQKYKATELTCEPDWSAASYAYSIAALAKKAEIFVPHLKQSDTQGDKIIADYMERFGVTTTYINGGAVLSSTPQLLDACGYSLSDYPDLTQTLAVIFTARRITAELSDISHLRHKETDRLRALHHELKQCDFLNALGDDTIRVVGNEYDSHIMPKIKTYGDHRMAMAFAPLALVFTAIDIDDAVVVEKSFPGYWKQLQNLGFEIEHLS